MQDSFNLVSEAKAELDAKIVLLKDEIKKLENTVAKVKSSIGVWYKEDDAETAKASIVSAQNAISDYKELIPSPYFSKIKLDNFPQKELFISKFTFPRGNVYSWVAPVAKLRFQNIGKTNYTLLNGQVIEIQILEKSKFKIRNQELKDLVVEDRSGVNKYLTDNRSEHKVYGLVDIIEKMEAYQDELIRMQPEGSILISGSAGSGKTTLALHKIAYLALSEEFKDVYKPKQMIVFVQDEGTKDYFNSLLPNLGIDDVTITTFLSWAKEKLKINHTVVEHSFAELAKNIILENAKKRILQQETEIDDNGNIIESLKSTYLREFEYDEYVLFEEQLTKNILDRYDITILMSAFLNNNKIEDKEKYSLIAVDEAENYLPQQISLLKNFINKSTRSIIYIGDLKQKTKAFALEKWSEVREVFQEKNTIKLPKSYRNTRQIIEYLNNRGFTLDIPVELKEGPEVVEREIRDLDELVQEIRNNLEGIEREILVGIIVDREEIKIKLQNMFNDYNVKILTIIEAQGVEFESVILVNESTQDSDDKLILGHFELMTEFIKIKKNLFYVGVTRAMNQLVVINYSTKTG
ncbi:AAA family ATPase [Candidatus Dojkabacteria bacterium]|uniref:DNA 3'-5' helicase n=1 Tax=Candidatus Dojkabacteria bacterium TaxID=2099670 RepID=A0A955RIL7_9BACT|nr:AAA family ATPase [Candidatus Dojkabacteria bacterium]